MKPKPIFRGGVNLSYPPLQYLDDSKPRGGSKECKCTTLHYTNNFTAILYNAYP